MSRKRNLPHGWRPLMDRGDGLKPLASLAWRIPSLLSSPPGWVVPVPYEVVGAANLFVDMMENCGRYRLSGHFGVLSANVLTDRDFVRFDIETEEPGRERHTVILESSLCRGLAVDGVEYADAEAFLATWMGSQGVAYGGTGGQV